MATKPCVVVFPGAFHPASCMDAFVTSLQSAGFQADAHTLRSVGNPDMGVADDESYMRSIMNPLIEAGQDVLLIVHSFAGFPGCSAISGIDKRGREARGEKGGVLGVVYLAAFVPMDGDSVYKLLRDNWEPWMEVNEPERLIDTINQAHTFYNDCSPEEAAAMTKTLKGHSIKALQGEHAIPKNIGWREAGYDGRRAYVRCTKDNALPLPGQQLFTERTGVEWVIKTLDASHSPFLSMPDATAAVVSELASEFLAA